MPKKTKPRHFGSVRTLPSGRLQASYLGADGKRVNADITFANKGDANAWLSTIEADKLREVLGKPKRKQKVTVGSYITNTFLPSKSGLAPNSQAHYEMICRLHIVPPLGGIVLTELTAPMVRNWHSELLEKTGKGMQANAYRVLRTIMNQAVDDEVIEFSPCKVKGAGELKPPKREILTPEEIELLASVMIPRYRAMVLVAGYGTMRFGELIGLRRMDVNLKDGWVKVVDNLSFVGKQWHIGDPKTEAGGRKVFMPPSVMAELATHLGTYVKEAPESRLFTTQTGKSPQRQSFYGIIQRAGKRIGRPDAFPHLLRHTSLTMTAESGATTKELLERGGHTSLKMAMRYQHPTDERHKLVAEKLDEKRNGARAA